MFVEEVDEDQDQTDPYKLEKRDDMDEEIKVNSLVELNSGGPIMTVVKISENDEVECIWFANDDSDGLSRATFPMACLLLESNEHVDD